MTIVKHIKIQRIHIEYDAGWTREAKAPTHPMEGYSVVYRDLPTLGMYNWRDHARNRGNWRNFVFSGQTNPRKKKKFTHQILRIFELS